MGHVKDPTISRQLGEMTDLTCLDAVYYASYCEESGAKLVYALNQSLDGHVDHLEFKPSQARRA
jgi:hypothetical protein